VARSQEKFRERRREVFCLLFSSRLLFLGSEEREEHLMEDVIYLIDHIDEKSDKTYLALLQCRYMTIFEQIKDLRESLDVDWEWKRASLLNLANLKDHVGLVWAELDGIEEEMRQDLKWMAQRCRRELAEPR